MVSEWQDTPQNTSQACIIHTIYNNRKASYWDISVNHTTQRCYTCITNQFCKMTQRTFIIRLIEMAKQNLWTQTVISVMTIWQCSWQNNKSYIKPPKRKTVVMVFLWIRHIKYSANFTDFKRYSNGPLNTKHYLQTCNTQFSQIPQIQQRPKRLEELDVQNWFEWFFNKIIWWKVWLIKRASRQEDIVQKCQTVTSQHSWWQRLTDQLSH